MCQRKSETPGKAKGPLPIRRNWKTLIAKPSRHVCHAPADTRGAERANLARECEKLFVRAVLTANARKASAQHTALKVATKLILYVVRIASACRAARASLGKECLGVITHEPIEHRVFSGWRLTRTLGLSGVDLSGVLSVCAATHRSSRYPGGGLPQNGVRSRPGQPDRSIYSRSRGSGFTVCPTLPTRKRISK